MFQEMINSSIAVVTRPSVSTFEEHEKDNLGWALIYSLIGAVIGGLLAAARAALFPTQIDPSQTAQLRELGLDAAAMSGQTSLTGAIIGALLGATIGFFIYFGLVYLLGRAFGGTGKFGELAYDISLFAVPFGVLYNLLSFVPILGGLAAFGLWIYSLYLTYLGIQSGMNLPSNKALYVILILAVIVIGIFLCFIAFFAVLIASIIGAGGR